MLFDEINPECGPSVTRNSVDFVEVEPARDDGIAAQPATSTKRNTVSYVDFIRHHKDRSVTGSLEAKGMLSSQAWHRPYAAALMETEPAKRAPLIVEAERAIFGRYLELCVVPAVIEHSIDLQNAVYYLSQLKKPIHRD